jgi:segregation and condensation protein B
LKDAALAELQAEEQARLALNETISDGPPISDEANTSDDTFLIDDESGATEQSAPADSVAQTQPETPSSAGKDQKQALAKEELKTAKARLAAIIDELIADYSSSDRGMEIRQIAGGYRMATKPEHHDAVVNFAKSLKPPVRLSLQALETLAVIAYKQPVTVPEISEIRGVDSAGVIATLLDRKLITTSGRKQVIGRPILYKTTKEFLMRFGLNDVAELPSVEEFEKLGDPQTELFSTPAPTPSPDVSPSSEQEPVTEAVPEPGSHLMGDTLVSAGGTRVTEGETVKEIAADSPWENGAAEETSFEETEPATEALPDPAHHHVAEESTMPSDGSYATEAEAGEAPEKL